MNKFEKLIEYIINDEEQKARELFHDIVVEKSRDIYESIMAQEAGMEETVAGDQVEDMVDEISAEEAVGEDDEMPADDGADEFGTDDDAMGMDDEMPGDDAGDHHADVGGEEELEDKVMDIDAKLDELLAKFDEIMGKDEMPGEEGEEESMGMMETEETMEEAKEEEEESVEEAKEEEEESIEEAKEDDEEESVKESKSDRKLSTPELMREYVDKIGDIYGGAGDSAEGDAVGAAGKKAPINGKSITGPGADFGGKAVKRTGADNANPDGTSAPSSEKPQQIKSGNVNVPGGKAAAKPAGVAPKTAEEGGTNQKSVQKPNMGK